MAALANNFKRSELNLWDNTGADNLKIEMNDNDVTVSYSSTHPGAYIKFPDLNIGSVEQVAATITAHKAASDLTKSTLDVQVLEFNDYKTLQESVITNITQSLTSETNRATIKENELQVNIDNLTTTVSNNRSELITKINEEKIISEQAVSNVQTQINTILNNTDTQALNSLTDLANTINNQGSDLTVFINDLQSRISQLEGIIEELLPTPTP